MSHQTGAMLRTDSLQIRRSTNWMKHWPPIQKMYSTQPTFHAEIFVAEYFGSQDGV